MATGKRFIGEFVAASLVSIVVVTALAMTGCGEKKTVEVTAEPGLPAGTVVIKSPWGRESHLVPVTMGDGTRCVAMVTNNSQGGISCDFPKVK